ncbi:MAG TPA: 50S ribosomal protein L25 [Anaerolineales bacterium]|nr:50S ribosomal protein L25 [Anaerolineales bacterium]
MDRVVLKATKRDVTGKQVKALRRSGQLPGIIYGRHVSPVSIALDAHSASLALSKLTSSSLVTIDVDGTEYPALVREKQRNYIKNTLLHVDFLAVNLTEKIRTSVNIEIVGLSLAVKDFNAVLVNHLTELEVECLPTDLPERILVDLDPIKQVGDAIHVRDIVVSDNVRVLDDPDEMIVVATYAKEEEVETPAAAGEAVAAEAVAEPELSVERGKKEEEGEEEKK